MKPNYSEQFNDPRWQKKRLEILTRDDFHCLGCFDGENTLHVHHIYYCKGRAPWEYPNFALVTLCSECHKTIESDCRNDDGNYILTEWEQVLDEFFPDHSLIELRVPNYWWHVAEEIFKVQQAGASHHECIYRMLHAINEYRSELEASKKPDPVT